MKYKKGKSKIKLKHHLIKGLRGLLEKIQGWDEIKRIIPGETRPTKSVKQLTLDVKYETATGIKCIAYSGAAVQEVFIITSDKALFQKHLDQFLRKSRV